MKDKKCIKCNINIGNNSRLYKCSHCKSKERYSINKLVIKKNVRDWSLSHPNIILQRDRKRYNVLDFRKEINNCIACNNDITDRSGQAKYCLKCSHKSVNYKFVNNYWIPRYNKNYRQAHMKRRYK